MPTVAKALARGSFATSSGTLYTVPASTTTVVTSVIIHNNSSDSNTFTLGFAGTNMHTSFILGYYETIVVDCKIVLSAAETITGVAGQTAVKYHISGVEIT